MDINSPAGSDALSLGDDNIRAQKVAVAENFLEDHVMEASGGVYDGADNGKHEKVSLKEQSAAPTTDSGFGIVYTLDVDSELELHYKDGSGNIVQITSGGALDLAGARLDNDEFLLSIDNAGTGTIDLIKANTDDNIEFGADVLFPGEFVWKTGQGDVGTLANDSNNLLHQLISGGDNTVNPASDDGTNWRKFLSQLEINTAIALANTPVLEETITGTGATVVDISDYSAIEVVVTPSNSNPLLDYDIAAGTGSVSGQTANWRIKSSTSTTATASSRHIVQTSGNITLTVNTFTNITNVKVYGWLGNSQA